MSSIIAVIPARGGSKGIPGKNLIDFCGKPLVAWSILQALSSSFINSVWVTSDDIEILRVAEKFGANAIHRPDNLSTDTATSESAWLHALDVIEGKGIDVELVVGIQATSPIRESTDLDGAISMLRENSFDSIVSVAKIEDFFTWRINSDGTVESINYDYRNRKRRQEIEKNYLENGSFYVFSPSQLRSFGNRLGGRIGAYVMSKHKMFQIDDPEDIDLCAAIMRGFNLA